MSTMQTSAASQSANIVAPQLHVSVRLPLDHFALEVDFTTRARAVGVFGPSGAGKTSVLRAIAGLEDQARGRISLGKEVWLDSAAGTWVPPEHRAIGYLPQDGLLFPNQNVRGNLLAGAARARREGSHVEELFDTTCRLLELTPLLDRHVATLSGGERQRVALGRAICSGPRLLLLDEPLASLDLPLRRRVLPFLRRVREQLEIPMLLVSHDPVEVQALCDDLVAVRRGTVVAHGDVRDVLTDAEVLPFGGHGGFDNVVPCTLIEHGAGSSTVRIGESSGVRLTVPKASGATGGQRLLRIPARDIIVSINRPAGLSARNVVSATIARIRSDGNLRMVVAEFGNAAPELAAVVTSEACSALSLEVGQHIYLIIKTASCDLYDGEREGQPE